MSWATAYSGTNNIHFDSPPLMSDGRSFASWQTQTDMDEHIRSANNIKSNWQYRQFLISNANDIMKCNMYESTNSLGVNAYHESQMGKISGGGSSGAPYMFQTIDTPAHHAQVSDLKNPYLTREQLQAKKIAPYR